MTVAAVSAPANAFEVKQKPAPDPAILEHLEAERAQAQADRREARKLRERGEEKVRRGEAKKQRALNELDAELCRMGALPPSECP